jgi:hypothetical protein
VPPADDATHKRLAFARNAVGRLRAARRQTVLRGVPRRGGADPGVRVTIVELDAEYLDHNLDAIDAALRDLHTILGTDDA